MKFEGVYIATVSPFADSGKLDLEALQDHLNFLADKGVHGFVPCGTTGETPTLSPEERRKSIALNKKIAEKHKLRVIAGCGGNSTNSVLELIEEVKDLGCDAALVVNPYYNKPTPAGLMEHFTFLADKGDFPIVLYNIPGRTNVCLSPKMISELLQHPNIVGIKEATGNLAQWLEIAETVDMKKNSLMAGDDNAFATILALGGSGIISASGNLVPEHFVAIYEKAIEGNLDEAFRLQVKLNPLLRAMFRETNPAPVKYGLQLRRGVPANLRLPLVGVSSETQEEVAQCLKGLELLP